MEPHPDFANTSLPRDFVLGTFRLTPLSPEFVDEDFDAVIATAPLLGGLFGDWPDGLTRDANLIDLSWHEREFTRAPVVFLDHQRSHRNVLGLFLHLPGDRGDWPRHSNTVAV